MKKTGAIIVVLIFVLLTSLFGYGNLITKKGGVLDDCILNTEDFFYKMDAKVQALSREGLKTGDAVNFVIPFKNGINQEELRYVKEFTDKLKDRFPEYGILSLSTVANYKDTGKELLNKPYINEEIFATDFNFENWKKDVKRDSGVYGLLIGRDFDYAQIVLTLPVGYDEITVFRKVAEFIENRKISELEWYLKTDIYPAKDFDKVLIGGWAMARGLMDAALISDVLKLSCIGLVAVWIFFFLSFMSVRQATISTAVIVFCFIWTRGSIGFMQMLGFQLAERAYFLLVYTSIIVGGISFSERKFESYNEARMENKTLDRASIWKLATDVNGVILFTAVIAVSNFATLYQIGVRGILEVGIFSAFGIIFLVVLVIWLLPSLHILIGGEQKIEGTSKANKLGLIWNKQLERMARKCFQFSFQENSSRPVSLSLAVLAIFLFGALVIIGADATSIIKKDFQFIEAKTKPMEYLPGTLVDKANIYLKQPGRYGFDRLSILVKPADQVGATPVESVDFFTRVDDFSWSLKSVKGIREINSALDTVKLITRESHKKNLPENSQQIHDALTQIEFDQGPQIKEQLWYNDGYIISASLSADDSNDLSRIEEEVLQVAKKHKDLEITLFGKLATYPRADKYVREGKPLNVITSQWMVIMMFACWIAWKNWRNRKNGHGLMLRPIWGGIVMNVPFVFASSVIVLVMAALRVPLDQATAVVTALAINAAADFSIYPVSDFMKALHDGQSKKEAFEYAIGQNGKIVLVDIALNCFCFIPLMASNFIPIYRLGWIMIIMLLSCGFGALVLMPALLTWCVKKNK